MRFSGGAFFLVFISTVLISLFQTCSAQEASSGTFDFRNKELASVQRASYDSLSLSKISQILAEHKTLELKRYSSGGHSAVTVNTPASLESAIGDLLILHWDRDNVMQALAEQKAPDSSELNNLFRLSPNSWKAGLLASLKHHYQYRDRFIQIIAKPEIANDFMKRPHIRYNPINFNELTSPWGHAQNDALSYVDFLLFYSLNKGKLNWNDPAIQPYAKAYGVLLPNYFRAIAVWQDQDLGAWEDKKAEHASSIGTAVAALQEELKYVQAHGALSWSDGTKDYKVTAKDLEEILHLAKNRLKNILPNEFIKSDNGEKRDTDAALINALFLGSVSGQTIVDDSMTLQIINDIESRLMGQHGISRYQKDIWDGRSNRKDLKEKEEAQWCHVSPMICVVLAELYQRTGEAKYLKKQTEHFNRTLAHINEEWQIPEAYIVSPESRQWVADANQPLAWAQAATILSLDAMFKSLERQNK